MANELSEEEIEALLAGGAEVSTGNTELSLAGMVQLLGHVRELVDANKRIAARNNDDMVQAIKGLTDAVQKKSFKPQDLKPLIDTLAECSKPAEALEAPTYVHTIMRGSKDGRILTITSTPETEE